MIKKIFLTCLLAITLGLTACANMQSVELKPADKREINTVYISPEVKVTPNIFYQGPAQSMGMAVGGLIGESILMSDENTTILMEKAIQKSGIDSIFVNAFEQELKKNGGFKLTQQPDHDDATFSFDIVLYGLGQTQGFSHTLYPTLGVTGTLKNREGNVIWKKYEYISPLNKQNSVGYEAPEYLQNPQLLNKAFENASKVISQIFIKQLTP